MTKQPIIKTPAQIAAIREAGKYLNELLILIAQLALPGTVLLDLEASAQSFLDKHQLVWSFKWYNGFPANLCLSVNDCVVHGIPDKTILKPGDLLKIDAGVTYNQGIADAAISIVIWWDQKNQHAAHLIRTTKQSLDRGIEQIHPHTSCLAFSKTVQKTLIQGGCSIIKSLTGHGVGVAVHEPPHLYNRPHESMNTLRRQPWRVVALEPITALKSSDFKEKPGNKRNLYTSKGDLWAQREYTLTITDHSYEILAGIIDRHLLK